ncbi:hypothetical protein MNBD_GAMMA26-732 [hydrothermal vent metagenome]|uniref:DUF2442 domain-containing protein n=1 Tax=hydrothermal vent metagenome TaxID=652676 RepID=A0A3B1BAT6_9ZZZZ
MYLSVKSVTPLADYELLLAFENGEERVFDVKPYLEMGKFSELKDTSLFNSVFVSFDSIEWVNQLDLDPEFLYQKSETAPAHNIN